MKLFVRSIAAIALAGCSLGAQALVTLSAPLWPPVGSTGLSAVEFNVGTGTDANGNGVQVALGAHRYKEGATMPNDGVSRYYANAGTSPNPDLTYARWAFDYSISYGNKTLGDYITKVSIDRDPSAAANFYVTTLDSSTVIPGFGSAAGLPLIVDSQNPEADFLEALMGVNFNPWAGGVYDFKIEVFEIGGTNAIASTNISVEVPEPGTLALLGLGLLGAGVARRRKQ